MKSKNYLLWSLALVLLFSLYSCKPKESAYRAAYEAAMAREMQENQMEEITPVSRPATDATADAVQRERVTPVDGATIRQFSVVIGSFVNRTNAVSLRDRMAGQGYNAFLAQNERQMFRVIVATFDDRAGAVAERNRIRERYYPDFQDVWILDRQ